MSPRPSRAEIEPLIANAYAGLFRETPGALAPHVEAAKAIYAARKVPSGDLAFDEELFADALRIAGGGAVGADGKITGGPIEFNGQLVLPPRPGLDEDAFADLVAGLTADDLARFGNGAPVFADGAAFTPGLFDAGLFRTDAQLLSLGPGRYRVFLPGLGYVVTPAGDAYEIDLRQALDAGKGRP